MGVNRRPPIKRPASEAEMQAFIGRAPDAKEQGASAAPDVAPAKAVAPTSSRKQGISLTLPPELIMRIDVTAKRLSLSRAAAIALACTKWVDAEQRGA